MSNRPNIGTFTPEQLVKWETVEQIAHQEADVSIVLHDGHTITLPTVLAVYNAFLWQVWLTFDQRITIDRVYFPDRKEDKETGTITYSLTSETIHSTLNRIYNELILKYNVEPYMNAVAAVFKCIQRFSVFADVHTREFHSTLDLISLAELCVQPAFKEIADRKIDCSHGTKYAEKQFEKLTNDMMKLLNNPTALNPNPLSMFMLTKLLKRNQVPQMFGAYGTRSDITDEMKKHAISESAMSGLKSAQDYGIEVLSARKAAVFNNTVIQKAQYFARRVRLGASKLHRLYHGWCGSEVTIPFTIRSKFKSNFLGKFVKVDDKTRHLLKDRKWSQYPNDDSVELTKDNIDLFVDREIQMWSPFGCRHTDGVCEHCAGYMHQKLHAYIPEDIWLGVFLSTFVVSPVTQKILSTKHLIKTSSKEYVIPEMSRKYMDKSGDALLFNKNVARAIKNQKLMIRMEQNAFLGPLADVTRKILPMGNAFSSIPRIALVDINGHVYDVIELSDGSTLLYLSGYAMHYLRQIYKKIRIDKDYVDIPMEDFDFSKAFLKYTAVNDDMVGFVNRVDNFVMKDVRNFTSISECLDRFTSVIWDKADVNIFPIEMLLRGYLASENSYDIPVITDPREPVRFGGLGEIISDAALSTKLSFEGLNALFESPKPTLKSIGSGKGYYDPLYAFAKCLTDDELAALRK
jgi:hypothetical protein